jgi:hypothetical protein
MDLFKPKAPSACRCDWCKLARDRDLGPAVRAANRRATANTIAAHTGKPVRCACGNSLSDDMGMCRECRREAVHVAIERRAPVAVQYAEVQARRAAGARYPW